MSNKFNTDKKLKKFRQAKKRMLSRMANAAIYHFKVVNFRKQGFVDSIVTPWPPRKSGGRGRRLLVDTGRGRTSIMRLPAGMKDSMKVGTLVRYMGFHNAGIGKQPKRQFVGDSLVLRKQYKKIILQELNNLMK